MVRAGLAGFWLTGLLLGAFGTPVWAVDARITVVVVEEERPLPLSRLDLPADDAGFAGARLGLDDNATTGGFLGHTFEAVEITIPPEEIATLPETVGPDGLVVVIGDADAVLGVADALAGTSALILNASAPDDRLRNEACRANVLHVAPSRAMKTDALAQFLVWKKWTDWLLIHGSHPRDRLLAEAYRRSATKFGARIVEERVYEDTGGARRSDSGHVLVQRQMPVFTQRAPDHDVVIAADESAVFGGYLPYRTWDPRPVAGSAGLEVLNWHPGHEGWGATQIQRRFERAAGRRMTALDYQAWLAVRILGEAVTRSNTADPAALRDYVLSDAFEIAAFKGQALTFRTWNNQLRNAILMTDGKLIVSVSPQEEFLHQVTRLDTLGYDEPESTCTF